MLPHVLLTNTKQKLTEQVLKIIAKTAPKHLYFNRASLKAVLSILNGIV